MTHDRIHGVALRAPRGRQCNNTSGGQRFAALANALLARREWPCK